MPVVIVVGAWQPRFSGRQYRRMALGLGPGSFWIGSYRPRRVRQLRWYSTDDPPEEVALDFAVERPLGVVAIVSGSYPDMDRTLRALGPESP